MVEVHVNERRILLVEDEPLIGRLCIRTLAVDGFQVDIACNGLVAKDMLGKESYRLCLIDIRTPAMNGIELYRYLEAEHPELLSTVIFTTGDMLSGEIQRFLKEVNRPFLAKPFTPHDLRAVVGKALK